MWLAATTLTSALWHTGAIAPVNPDNPNGPHNFGWRGIGGPLFAVDPANDFFVIYMEQRRGGPPNAPFDNSTAQRMVNQAVLD